LRLDKYLYFARITKTRALAQAIIEERHVRINGSPISCSHPSIAVGKVITLPIHKIVRVFRVEALPTRRGPATEAQRCYCNLDPKRD
jgi:ribosome-associated heat shock protein Hsp15